jgi:hypothetical protein
VLALIAVVLAADVSTQTPPPPPREPKVVVDFAPNATAMGLLAGAPTGTLLLYLPVSVTYVVSQSTAIRGTVALGLSLPSYKGPEGSVAVSVGPLYSFGPSAVRGFFIAPKLLVQLSSATTMVAPFLAGGSNPSTQGPLDIGPGWSQAYLAGLDVGYQWAWDGRYIAVMIGGSVGYQYDNGGPFVDGLGTQRGFSRPFGTTTRNQGFAFSVDANVFHVGFTI